MARPQLIDPTTALGSTRRVEYGRVRIATETGPHAGYERVAAGGTLRVGSSRDNDVVLEDPTVSRHHCELELGASGVRVRDLGSTNGVFAKRLRVFDAVLQPPFQLALGETVLSLSVASGSVTRERSVVERFGDLLGGSGRMRELYADLQRIAPSDVSLLIEGETGTGKELVAESVHRESRRADKPLVVFDCSAVAPALVESELFGHERGAFTGAHAARAGLFELAHGGTVFLDELGELPLELQPKLLRVLEKREVRRVGGARPLPFDVRVVAATNRALQREVESGRFREDLYFRIAGAHVKVPPLRERRDDLPLLIDHFMAQLAPGLSHHDLPHEVWSMFLAHRWPGNVRELRNAVQRFLITPERPLSATSSSPPQAPGMRPPSGTVLPLREARREASDRFEREYLRALLERTAGNVTRAAALAEVSRQMVQKLARRHGVACLRGVGHDADGAAGS